MRLAVLEYQSTASRRRLTTTATHEEDEGAHDRAASTSADGVGWRRSRPQLSPPAQVSRFQIGHGALQLVDGEAGGLEGLGPVRAPTRPPRRRRRRAPTTPVRCSRATRPTSGQRTPDLGGDGLEPGARRAPRRPRTRGGARPGGPSAWSRAVPVKVTTAPQPAGPPRRTASATGSGSATARPSRSPDAGAARGPPSIRATVCGPRSSRQGPPLPSSADVPGRRRRRRRRRPAAPAAARRPPLAPPVRAAAATGRRRAASAAAAAPRPAARRGPSSLVAGLAGAVLAAGLLAVTGSLVAAGGRAARRREGRRHPGRVHPDAPRRPGRGGRRPSGCSPAIVRLDVDRGRRRGHRLRRGVPRRRACCSPAPTSSTAPTAIRVRLADGRRFDGRARRRSTRSPTSPWSTSTPTTSRWPCSAPPKDLEVGAPAVAIGSPPGAEGRPVGHHRRRQRHRAARIDVRRRRAPRDDPDRRPDRGRLVGRRRWSTPPAP